MGRQRILVAAMDWGLGHAARCVPIVKALQACGRDVWLGGSGHSLAFLQQECPGLPAVTLPAYNIRYGNRIPLWAMLLWQLPRFVFTIIREHRVVSRFVVANKIEGIISDNRYGCRVKGVPSVLVTHQLKLIWPPALRWFGGVGNAILVWQVRKFSACWVPDDPRIKLTGVLTDVRVKFRFIGFLSRFAFRESETNKYDMLVLLSGVEPQRSILEQKLLPQLATFQGKVMLARGIGGGRQTLRSTPFNVEVVDILTGSDLESALQHSALVICRSGYSTLMDLIAMQKNAVLIPTPGQTEQEYLAAVCKALNFAWFEPQNSFDLSQAIMSGQDYTGFKEVDRSTGLLDAALQDWLG